MKYWAKGVVEALKIKGRISHCGTKDSDYVVECENDKGVLELVFCCAYQEPEVGDYVIFQDVAEDYHCPREVFEKKYEVLK